MNRAATAMGFPVSEAGRGPRQFAATALFKPARASFFRHPCGDPAEEADTARLGRHPTPLALEMLPYHRACLGTVRGSHFLMRGDDSVSDSPSNNNLNPKSAKCV
jgi:hypothetical protein